MLEFLGRFTTRRPKAILWLTALVVVMAIGLGSASFGKLQGGGFDDPRADSVRALNELEDRFGGNPDLVFLVSAKAGNVNTPAVTVAGRKLTQDLEADPNVKNVQSFWSTGGSALESRDSKEALVMVHVVDGEINSDDYADTLITRYSTSNAELSVKAGGAHAINRDITNQVTKDLTVAESIAIPLTLILLVLAFGAVMAALLPLAIGIVAIFGTFASLFVIGSITDVSIYALNLTTSLGLGLGVDYALLMVNRFREELAVNADVGHAVRRTLATAGHTIVFSAGTVALALAALLVFPPFFLRSFAYAGIAVVVVAMLSAIVILPALLMVLGPRVNKWKLPRISLAGGESASWHRLAAAVVKRPILAAVPVLIVIGVLAAPVLHVSFASPDDRVIPTSFASRQVGDILRQDFAVDNSTAMYAVIAGDTNTVELDAYAKAISTVVNVDEVSTATGTYAQGKMTAGPSQQNTRYAIPGTSYLSIIPSVDFVGDAGQKVVLNVRAVDKPINTTVRLGGAAPTLVDEKRAISNHLPLAILWIVITTLVLLFAYTRSLLLPIKALLLNGLTLAAVMGTMTWIFQEGHLSSLLGFTPRPLDTSMPVLLFCVAFGLSMDYEVFLLSRIKEAHEEGASNTDAVVVGLARTGRIVSTAAGLLAVTFIAFGTSKVEFIQMFGIGTAMAILIDATIVRGVLVPAFMQLAGRANWWAPKFLRPRVPAQ